MSRAAPAQPARPPRPSPPGPVTSRSKPRRRASPGVARHGWPARTRPASDSSPARTVPAAHRPLTQARGQRHRHRQVGGRLLDAQAAGHVDVDVVAGQVQAGVARQHGDQHQHPADVDPGGRAPRRAATGRRHQRLDLDRQRPRPLQRDGDRAAGAGGCSDSRKKRLASATSTRPSPRISSTPTSSVEPKRFLAARSRRWRRAAPPPGR